MKRSFINRLTALITAIAILMALCSTAAAYGPGDLIYTGPEARFRLSMNSSEDAFVDELLYLSADLSCTPSDGDYTYSVGSANWTTSDPTVAEVSGSGMQATVRCVGIGTAVISLSMMIAPFSEEGNAVTLQSTCTVTVTQEVIREQPRVTGSISMQTSASIPVGGYKDIDVLFNGWEYDTEMKRWYSGESWFSGEDIDVRCNKPTVASVNGVTLYERGASIDVLGLKAGSCVVSVDVDIHYSDYTDDTQTKTGYCAVEVESSNHTITATAKDGGTISPAGTTTVANGASKVLTITAKDGYAVDYVTVNNDKWEFETAVEGKTEVTINLNSITEDKNVVAYFVQTALNPGFVSPFEGLYIEDFNNIYSDVTGDEWYYDYLALMSLAGLHEGVDFSRKPTDVVDNAVTKLYNADYAEDRGDTVQRLYNVNEAKESPYKLSIASYNSNPFGDVSQKANFYDSVLWAAYHEIVNGYGDGTFGPYKTITREQMCAIIVRAVNKAGLKLPTNGSAISFTDSSSISSWAKSAVTTCQRAGIINGYPDGSFRPKTAIVHSDVDKMMAAFIAALGGKTVEEQVADCKRNSLRQTV